MKPAKSKIVFIYFLLFSTSFTVSARERDEVWVGVEKNHPAASSCNDFASSKMGFLLGYYHPIIEDWSASVAVQFKNFREKQLEEDFSFLTASQGIYYNLRLAYPTYLQVGGKLLYLLPVTKASLPVERKREYANEIGASIVVGLRHPFSDRMSVGVYLERWRGTKTMMFHGIETLLVFGYGI